MALILVVDDSITARTYCRKVLAAAGHEVQEAASGREALATMDERRPDCVVLDLMMPDMSGIELLRALGEEGDAPPIVVLTSDLHETVRAQCERLGARAFINKPAPPEALRLAVAKAIAEESRG
jgi:CheY-like chemotaxis protein